MSVSSSIGPVSGIDYGKLITGLTGLAQKPIDDLTTRIGKLDEQNTALLGLSALMTSLKVAAANFSSSAIFRAASATSGNPSVATAIAGIGTPTGNYTFNVQRLASASQQVTQGFADSNTALGLSGSIKLQLGGGKLDDVARLTTLNGGSGVARGGIRVTDRSGASALIDLSHAVDVKDVVNTINSATGVNVVAKIDGDKFVITDNTGGSGTLSITNSGGTTTATDLGLTAAAVGGTLTGTSITKLNSTSNLDLLNDGLGVRNAGILDDFSIAAVGGTFNVSLSGAKTLGDVITKINTAGSSAGVTATISASGTGISLTDAGGGPLTVSALNSSFAAKDLGIAGTSAGGTLTGDRIISTLQGPLLSNLRGGWQGQVGESAPTPGTLTINAETIDLSSARTLDDVIKALNTNSQGVTAALNSAGTGITLTSASGSFTVADGTGNLGSFLNISGTSTATATGSKIDSGDLRLRYISENKRLASLNGGAGVKLGSIKVSDGNGATLNLDLTSTELTTIGAVIKRINTSGLAISARVNDTGDGLLLTQTAGTGVASISDINNGTTAKDLGIAGTFSSGKLDGSFQKSVTVGITDTLNDIAKKLNDAGAGLSASVINDGSGGTPFRLSLSSRNAGVAGRLIFDGSAAGLTTTTLVEGQDAAVVFGGSSNGTGGLLATSSNNTFAGLVPGLTLTLSGIGSTSVSVNRDDAKIKTSVSGFVEAYNKVIDNIAEVTKFNKEDPSKNGVLFGNAVTRQVEQALGDFVGRSFNTGSSLRTLSAVGITIGQDGKLSLNEDRLGNVLANSPDDLRSLFTTNTKAVAGGPRSISLTTRLSDLSSTGFPGGHISITDGFGDAHDIDLSSGVSTIGDVITKINAGTAGKVTAGLNTSGDGILLVQVGGTGTASVAEVGAGTAADALNIKGTFTGGQLNGAMLPVLPKSAVKGVGGVLTDLLDRFTNAQSGLLFQTSDSIGTQQRQLRTRQTALAELLIAKRNRLVREFANLEVTISQLQQQGTAITNFKAATATK